MSMILVVGASGQLGGAVVSRALDKGRAVRALVRATSRYEHLKREGVEICFGDLRDVESLWRACRGVEGATVKRAFWMTDLMRRFGRDVEKRGRINVVGSGRVRRSYICAEDVAKLMVNAVGREEARNRVFEIGGPEALSQMDVVAI